MGRSRAWLNHVRVQVLTPGEFHSDILFQLLAQLGTAGNLTTDAVHRCRFRAVSGLEVV
jgi:hypothetical protein